MLRRSGPLVPSRHPVNRQLFDEAPLDHVESLEQRILQLEQRIVEALKPGG